MNDPARAPARGEVPDAELVARILAGERSAYRVLVRRYQASLHRIAVAMVSERDVAEDLVQDAFVRCYRNLARCHDPARFRFWLITTLRNRALDHLKEKRRTDLSLSDDGVLRHVESAAPPGEDPGERLAIRSAVLAALDRLTPPLREAFVLRHVEEHSFEEIAALLGTGVSAVKMRVHRARLQLQMWLAAEWSDAPAERPLAEETAGKSRRPTPGVTGAGHESSEG